MLKTIKQNDFELKLNVETDCESHRFDSFFDKEPETITWIQTLVKPNDIFFDIGANIGIYSLFAKGLYGNQIKVFAFEPVYHNYERLCRNIVDNKFINIMPYCVAISDKTQFGAIELASNIAGSANHLLKSAPDELFKNFIAQFEQGTFNVTLDDLVGKYDFPCPNHIKIDVDGVELQVVNGAKNILSSPALNSILIEINNKGGVKEEIEDIMRQSGFKSDHPINFQLNHSRARRQKKGSLVENIIFTR